MDEHSKDTANGHLTTTESKLWLPPSFANNKALEAPAFKKSSINWGFANKSFWDWALLLGTLLAALGAIAIPFVVTILGLNLTQQQAQLSITASERQHQTDLQIAQDQQRETTLKAYLDDISDLLLNHNLRRAKSGDEVSLVARERTLTTLRRLDANRNKIVLQFLHEAHLIGVKNSVINLNAANLSSDDLRGVNLSGTNLSGDDLIGVNLIGVNFIGADLSNAELVAADLSGDDLQGANLSGASFSDIYHLDSHYNSNSLHGADLLAANLGTLYPHAANLRDADLSNADLSNADLIGVYLRGAILTYAHLTYVQLSEANLSSTRLDHADLTGAYLDGADISNATLIGAKVTEAQLVSTLSLKDTFMPNGSLHP